MLLKCALGIGDQKKKNKALAALIYFLQIHDTLPDEGIEGYLDDQLVLSDSIRAIGLPKDTNAGQWAQKVYHESDAHLPRWLQEKILKEFSGLEAAVGQIVISDPAGENDQHS